MNGIFSGVSRITKPPPFFITTSTTSDYDTVFTFKLKLCGVLFEFTVSL